MFWNTVLLMRRWDSQGGITFHLVEIQSGCHLSSKSIANGHPLMLICSEFYMLPI